VTVEGVEALSTNLAQEVEMNSWGYVKRAVELVRSEYLLFSVALLCLGLFNLLSLLLPRLQGTILDAVVNDRQSRFNSNILLYLYVSIATGFFGGLQSLCFSVVGRRVAKTVRCRLFRGIVTQVSPLDHPPPSLPP
jgi:ABC-type multidrug transport system fused ATPase/permease subunit